MPHKQIRNVFNSKEPVTRGTLAWVIVIGPILFMVLVLIGFIISNNISENRDLKNAREQRGSLCLATELIIETQIKTYRDVIDGSMNPLSTEALQLAIQDLIRIHGIIARGCENAPPAPDVN